MLGEYIGSITHAIIVSVAHQEESLEVVAAHAKAVVCFLAVISFVETNLRSAEAGRLHVNHARVCVEVKATGLLIVERQGTCQSLEGIDKQDSRSIL